MPVAKVSLARLLFAQNWARRLLRSRDMERDGQGDIIEIQTFEGNGAPVKGEIDCPTRRSTGSQTLPVNSVLAT